MESKFSRMIPETLNKPEVAKHPLEVVMHVYTVKKWYMVKDSHPTAPLV